MNARAFVIVGRAAAALNAPWSPPMAIPHAHDLATAQIPPPSVDTTFPPKGSPPPTLRSVLMAILPDPGQTAPIDPILDALTWHCPAPYDVLVAAALDGTIAFEFARPLPGETLCSVVIRRL